MDKIEKIKAEIERRAELNTTQFKKGLISVETLTARDSQLLGLNTFLDTLSEEPDKSLEEAARHSEILTYPMPNDGGIDEVMKVQEARIFHEIGFKAGAEWQKEQMLKDAVEGRIVNINSDFNDIALKTDQFRYATSFFNDGDKVKIIIVKED